MVAFFCRHWMGTLFSVFVIGLFAFMAYTIWATREVNVRAETLTVEIVGVYPPKHARVDLRNTQTGEAYVKVAISKHFNNWRDKLIVGRVVTVTREQVTWADGRVFYRWPRLYDILQQ